ncbi:endophilin-A2 [Acipenser ruthenus]|uniref:endophilin-A2 n=1 Tax=Acipenser ruthenus TaxID=7906 RepID=UPI002741F147|nr:endophilin-A2 [Acipenser ruthenus]
MSVAGLKKQFYKASQLVSEKVGGAEGTKLDEDFKELERKVDVTSKAVSEVITKTSEYLQPNPASRAKLSMLNTVSKIRGQVKNPGYPQPEGLLGECMAKFGRELGEETNFGGALLDAGETMKRLAEVKDSLDIDVKQNFIDPLQSLCDKDLREIQHHLKKLEGRRLDYDYKKKRQGKIPDEEVRQALEKFDESKEVAETSMYNLLETDIEQVSQLSSLVEAQLDYHRQAVQVMEDLSQKLKERMAEATTRPKREYTPKPKPVYDYGDTDQSNGDFAYSSSAPSAAMAPSARAPGEETAHTRTHTPTHTPTPTPTRTHTHARPHTRTPTHAYTHAHPHTHTHTHARPHTRTPTHARPHTWKKHLCVSGS